MDEEYLPEKHIRLYPETVPRTRPKFSRKFKVTRPSYFVSVLSYFEALWYPHLHFDRKSNI